MLSTSFGARTALRLAIVLAATSSSIVAAQTVAASNSTDVPAYGSSIALAVAHGNAETPAAVIPLLPLTGPAGKDVPSTGLEGSLLLANSTTFLAINPDDIALISCDSVNGFVHPDDIFAAAEDSNATAIVFYSQSAEWCSPANYDSYRWIYTLKGRDNTDLMLKQLSDLADAGVQTVSGRIASRDEMQSAAQVGGASNDSNNATSSNNNGSPANPLGPSPSTAVAMIILYSITGVITALFLIIIITGAVRAHRHPERYGPRNVVGRPRQGRARGIARAMLDSIPIVKFGDRTEQPAKPGEVELERGRVEDLGDQNTTTQTTATGADATLADATVADAATRGTTAQSESGPNESGSVTPAAAATETKETPPPTDDTQGCSICTEDFQVGEDQRVLPCDHRFHPVCIDPWLLNVSGTCPLCRIDLRPPEDEASELDQNGNNTSQTEAHLAPPLGGAGGDSRRISMRRSIMLGLMGIPRPERMTREERLHALRRYRQQAQERAANAAEAPAEDESSRRRRLRNVFRIRTRRTGGDDTAAQEDAAPPQDTSVVDGPSRT